MRFELRDPRLRVETRGEVAWATLSGQCGIRFLDLSPRMTRQINEWIFGNLLEGAAMHTRTRRNPCLPDRAVCPSRMEEDGLMVSAAPVKVIELPMRADACSRLTRVMRRPCTSHRANWTGFRSRFPAAVWSGRSTHW